MSQSQPSPHPSDGVQPDIAQIANLHTQNADPKRNLSQLRPNLQHSTQTLSTEETLSLLNTILEASADGILALNGQGHITHFNQKFIELWNVPESVISLQDDWQLLTLMREQLVEPEVFLNQVQREYHQADLESHSYLQLKDGRSFERYSKPQILGEEIIGRVISYRDITSSRQMEIALRQSEERFRVALYNSPIVVFNQDVQLRYTWVYNPTSGTDVDTILGKRDEDLLPQDYAQRLTAIKQSVLVSGVGTRAEISIPSQNEIQFFDLKVEPLRNEINEIVGITCAATNITELKRVEVALRQSQELFQAVINAAPTRIYLKDLQGQYVIYNHLCESVTQLKVDQVLGKTDFDLFAPERARYHQAMDQAALEAGQPITYEMTVCDEAGEMHTYMTTKFPVFDSERQPYGVCGISTDISDRKKIETELATLNQELELKVQERTQELERRHREFVALLDEKTVLLKEIHHRVKNNLQTISSLLRLQAAAVKDFGTLEILRESQNRVLAMAIVHETLYQSKSLASINFADYVHKLTNELVKSYDADFRQIQISVEVADVELSPDIVVPCGLIINELVSNAFGHAFFGNQPGEIKISFSVCDGSADDLRQYNLTVQDDGVGLPPEIEPQASTSLGLRLVYALARQLNAKVEVNRDRGSRFTITFQNQSM